ncbi:MAG: response regulator [Planctomycetota bacterium]
MSLEQKDNLNENTSAVAEADVSICAKRILVVDDEKDLVVMISKALKYQGYEVITANDGQEGLEKAKTEKPDLIVLDLMLPKINGYKVCGLLKKDTRYAKVPIILFTAKANAEDIELGKQVGADAYITKPYERDALLSKIEELIKE